MAVSATLNADCSGQKLQASKCSNDKVDKAFKSLHEHQRLIMNMKKTKKEQKKPELQLYRPGMGLQNKNAKSDESNLKSNNGHSHKNKGDKSLPSVSVIDFHNDEKLEASDTDKILEKKSQSKADMSNSANKNSKNRRPDLQVYMPKPKVIAQLNEKKTDSSKGDIKCEKANSFSAKTPNKKKQFDKINDATIERPEDYIKSYKDKILNSRPNSSSPHSWADIVEESDISTSRSTPENKILNGHIEYIDKSYTSTPISHSKEKHKSNNRGSKRKNAKETSKSNKNKNTHRQAHNSISSEEKSNLRAPDSDLNHNNRESQISDSTYAGKSRRYNRRRHNSGNASKESTRENGTEIIATNKLSERLKNVKVSISNDVVQYINNAKSECDDNSSKNERIRNEKKNKREKSDQVLPPRFQKNKSINHNLPPSEHGIGGHTGTGGILKLPSDYTSPNIHSEILENNMYVPKVKPFVEPQMFIHKQLFDPNNPEKPEIVNIPAPSSSSQMSFPNIGSKYYAADPYIPAPVQNMGYIPPPQPPVVPQYQFLHSDVPPMTTMSENFYINESIAPPLPSIPDVRLNSVFTRSHLCYEMPSNLIEHGKKRLKPIVEKNLNDIVLLERELASLLLKGICDTNLNALRQCRWKLQLRYENIILADPKYCAERNAEQSLWKSAFYQIIETLRKKLEEDQKSKEETKELLLNVILEGSVFYENLLEKQQETFGFNLSRLLEMEQINTSCIPEQIRIVLISTQKILIYLGDLARYKEQVNQTANYGKARSWYLKAQQIVPKNGRPYHQLAILALSTRRKLDAVYYFMRSLAASNPFLSAKESLLSLFEEAKKKYEMCENKKKQASSAEVEIPDDDSDKRVEVWIKPDGSSSHKPAELDKNMDSSDVKNLSDVELNKRFVISFLHVHGKLFTKVGMETFPETLNHMLKEFYFLLQRSPVPLTSVRLLQLLAINIFAVTNSSLKENGREHGGSSLLQEQALYTSMVMMSMVMERCKMLHIAHKSSPEYSNQALSDDLVQLLPSVKIWTDWMSCQKCLWPPPPVHILENLNIGFNKNIWASFADLLTVFREIDTSSPVIISERKEGSEPIVLEEDCTLSGFVPLLGVLHDPAYAIPPFDKERAKHCVRIMRIQFFGDYLCGITPPYLEFDVEHKKFIALVNQMPSEDHYERSTFLQNSTDDSYGEEVLDEDLIGESSRGAAESNELQVLWSRKEALSKAKEQQEKYRAQVQAVLQKDQSQQPIMIKIKPRYLIPDTNCFIDHLRLLRNILTSLDFHLIVPLVVINELDGLARGTRVNPHSSPDHANRVTILSREAVHFLEEQFALRHPRLRAITSKGSVLDTISFRSEEMGKNKGTNDDLILSCCLNYCKDRAELYMPKNRDEPIQLFREVVLLTDDRNLRVKALAHNVPVRDLLSFLQWANS